MGICEGIVLFLFSQICSLPYPECLHFQQWDCCTWNHKISFSSSYNKTYKTYWEEMLLLNSLFINCLLHKLREQAYHQRTKYSYSFRKNGKWDKYCYKQKFKLVAFQNKFYSISITQSYNTKITLINSNCVIKLYKSNTCLSCNHL